MIKSQKMINLYDLEKAWYDSYGESFSREYPGAFEKLTKLVRQRMNIPENRVIDRTRSGNAGSITRTRQTR